MKGIVTLNNKFVFSEENRYPERRKIDERGQLEKKAQSTTTNRTLSTPIIVAVTLIVSGALLLAVSLVLITVHYFSYSRKRKISQPDPESGNSTFTQENGTPNNLR